VARIDGDQVAISMGEPDFTPARIPFVTDSQADEYDLKTPSGDATVGVVSMGNPHAVMLVDDVDRAPVGLLGPELENHAQFPNRANIGFMQIVDRGHVRLRVYERGAGETRACGTGACAAMAVGRRAGLLDEKVSVQLPGGALCVKWSGPGDEAWLAGEAVTVFEGEVDI
jgi:diaminopimelate epimerase